MAKQFERLALAHRAFIDAQHIFFVATAADNGRVNLSPKGMNSLRVLDENRIPWRNSTGSGNETAGHLLRNNRMTLMWCAFDDQPLILRCYGAARTIHRSAADWDACNAAFPADIGARQFYEMTIDMVQTSCGYGVPRMAYEQERPDADAWSDAKGVDGIRTYWDETNRSTIDGFPTGIEANL